VPDVSRNRVGLVDASFPHGGEVAADRPRGCVAVVSGLRGGERVPRQFRVGLCVGGEHESIEPCISVYVKHHGIRTARKGNRWLEHPDVVTAPKR
jgi:hypothetical protein